MAPKTKPTAGRTSKSQDPTPAAAAVSDNAYDAIMRLIFQYESRLDKDHEVALVTLAHQSGFYLTAVEYDPCGMLAFIGFDDRDRPVMVIQDDTRLNVELVMLPKRRGGGVVRIGRE